MREHCADNGVETEALDLVWAVAAAQPGFVPFPVGRASAHYGQTIRRSADEAYPDVRQRRRLKARAILGRPPASADGVRWVPAVTLEELLSPYPRVDLVDLDVQGLELAVLTAAMDLIETRVRRLHIGTHSTDIEAGLRELLSGRHWECVHDYPCQARAATPYGEIAFGDGVQTWLNPSLAPSLRMATMREPGGQAMAVRFGVGWTSVETTIARLEQRIEALKAGQHELREKNARLRDKLEDERRHRRR
jgi:hypothetical protein